MVKRNKYPPTEAAPKLQIGVFSFCDIAHNYRADPCIEKVSGSVNTQFFCIQPFTFKSGAVSLTAQDLGTRPPLTRFSICVWKLPVKRRS